VLALPSPKAASIAYIPEGVAPLPEGKKQQPFLKYLKDILRGCFAGSNPFVASLPKVGLLLASIFDRSKYRRLLR
jgi:hypothetical protein